MTWQVEVALVVHVEMISDVGTLQIGSSETGTEATASIEFGSLRTSTDDDAAGKSSSSVSLNTRAEEDVEGYGELSHGMALVLVAV
jgi:hypothetical protein